MKYRIYLEEDYKENGYNSPKGNTIVTYDVDFARDLLEYGYLITGILPEEIEKENPNTNTKT